MSLLDLPNFLPPGISVQRDNLHINEGGDAVIRVIVQRDTDRLCQIFEVPHYKTIGYLRTGFFTWKKIEVVDHERIRSELLEKGKWAIRELLREDSV